MGMRWNGNEMEWVGSAPSFSSFLSFPSDSLLLIYYKFSSSSWWWFICFSSSFLPVSFGKCTANLLSFLSSLFFFFFFALTQLSFPCHFRYRRIISWSSPWRFFRKSLYQFQYFSPFSCLRMRIKEKRMWGKEEGNWWVKRLTPFTFTHRKALQQLSGEQVFLIFLIFHLLLFPLKRKQCAPFSIISFHILLYWTHLLNWNHLISSKKVGEWKLKWGGRMKRE